MVKQKLDEIACAALAQLMAALAALRELAWLNRRMTARGVVAVLVYAAAYFGFEISAAAQAWLASGLFLYLGIVGRDRQRR
jgi:hypothetical protein